MTPQQLLSHYDNGQLWPDAPGRAGPNDVAQAYRDQLALRALRVARGEQPRGFKIGFTNRGIWPRYNVFSPIWATVWDTTLSHCEGQGAVHLGHSCQPRLEPEAVFGMARTPPADASLDALFACLDWVAPGFEVVQSHCRDWKFAAAESVADGGLHAHLLVGPRVPAASVAPHAQAFDAQLAQASVTLRRGDTVVDEGCGANVLDGPLHALAHFLQALRDCPGAPDLQPGDVVTTGTWTDAWPVHRGEQWRAAFDPPLAPLSVRFV